jgi:hypothetical protein
VLVDGTKTPNFRRNPNESTTVSSFTCVDVLDINRCLDRLQGLMWCSTVRLDMLQHGDKRILLFDLKEKFVIWETDGTGCAGAASRRRVR